jgi:hypothetical protein
MATDLLKPRRGGFQRAFGCAEFIRDFLGGSGPYGSTAINAQVGAPQAEIFYEYKTALIRETALDKATAIEEKQARKTKRPINPENIQALSGKIIARMPYKTFRARYHSFVVYFSQLERLEWVVPTGEEEPSAFQANYTKGQPRKYYRLTQAGLSAPDSAWANPQRALVGHTR